MADGMDAPLGGTGPESQDLLAGERKRKRTRALAGVGLVLALGAGGYGALAYSDARARARVDGAWGAFGRCLLGEPLGADERPSGRMRAVQLAVMAVPPAQRAKPGEVAWPGTCSPLGHRVNETLRDAGRATKDERGLAVSVERLAKLLSEDKSLSADLSEAMETTWTAAAAEHVNRAAADGPSAPTPAKALSADSLRSTAPLSPKSFALSALQTSHYPTATLRFVLDQKDVPNAPALCSSARGATSVSCTRLADPVAALSPGLRLWGAVDDDAAPLVFAGDRGAAGIVRTTGERLTATMTYGARWTKEGVLSFLSWDDKEKKVALDVGTDGKRRELLFGTDDVGNPYYNVGLLWDDVVWKTGAKGGGLHLYARPLGSDAKATVDVGELAEPSLVFTGDEAPHVAGCRTDQAIVARIRGTRSEQLAFKTAGKWQAPILAPGLGGTLTCRGAEATLTRLESAVDDGKDTATVVQTRCSAAGCRAARLTPKDLSGGARELLPVDVAHLAAADVDGKLVVAWATGGPGGVRMKAGLAEEIGKQPAAALFDDLVQDGAVKGLPTLFELRILSRGDVALLLVSTVAGVHVLSIDGAGKVTPMPVEWK